MTSRFPFHAERVFVDTSAFFALSNDREAYHQTARRLASQLAESRARLFTTNFIVAETHAIVLRKVGHGAAATVLRELDSGSTVVVRVEIADERRARAILQQYDDKDFSLTDSLSFAVMERLGIDRAFAFDRHFAQYGFQIVETE